MRLTGEARAVLGGSSIGMLALRAGRGGQAAPLVNPAVFSVTGDELWMTTSRFAAKTLMARRDPRAAFMVDGAHAAVLLRGSLEVFDPLSLSSQVRAMLDGPRYLLGMAGYALRNSPFVAGYVLDLTQLPREWMPYNRVVLRLRLSHAEVIETPEFPPAQAARVPSVPAEVSRRLAGVARGYACWIDGATPVIVPAFWDTEAGVLRVAPADRSPHPGQAGALVVESRHRFRPSLMVGACVRGTFTTGGGRAGSSVLAERYGLEATAVPAVFELRPERVTSWRGFAVVSIVPRSARQLRLVHA